MTPEENSGQNEHGPRETPPGSAGDNEPSPRTDASTSAFLTAGREVDGPCLNEDIPPYHPPVADPDGRLAQAQLVGALLVSNALIRSFLSHKYPLDSLTTLPQCIEQWCQAHPLPLHHFPCLPKASLTLSVEWGYDRSLSRMLFDHTYVRKLPIDACDPNTLRRYVRKTAGNDAWNVSRLYEATLRYTDAHEDEDAPHDILVETCAAPLPWTHRARLLHDTLTEICDLCQVEQTTAEVLCRYYLDDATPADIERTYGVTIEAVRKRLTRAIQKDPLCGAQAKAVLQELITTLQRTEGVSPRKRTHPEKGEADEDQGMLEPETAGWRGRDFPTLTKRRSTAKEA